MFVEFDESARLVVVTAEEEARALRHAAIGGDHVLLGITKQEPVLLNVALGVVREHVIARGTGQTRSPEYMPLTAAAKNALERAANEVADRGHDTVRPAHILLALLRVDAHVRSVVEALGCSVDDVKERAEARAEQPSTRSPREVHQALREGRPVAVALGDGVEVGDLGNPQTDARILRAMLACNGRAAELLRDHGVNEDAIRGLRRNPD